jgi:hypothetical protein
MSAELIAHDFGWPTLISCAKAGAVTMPDTFVQLYDELFEAGQERPRDENKLNTIYAALMKAFGAAGGGEGLIRDHVQPALADYLATFTDDIAVLGKYVNEVTVPLEVIGESEKVRTTYLRWVASHPRYYTIRAVWKVLASKSGGCIDPLGIESPFAEVRNLDQLVADWERAIHGRAQWPWTANAHWVRLAWIIQNGGHVWAPTIAELNDAARGRGVALRVA